MTTFLLYVLYDGNEPNLPNLLAIDESLITPLERYLDNHPSKESRAYKLLGIYIDEQLSLNFHTEYFSKLTKSLYCISNKPSILLRLWA
jgi:hypothetical protein